MLKSIEIDLKVIRLCRNDSKPTAYRLHEHTVLREKRRKGDELIPGLAKRLEYNRHGRRCARGHEEIFPCNTHVQPLGQIRCNRFTHLGLAGCNRITVHLDRIVMHQNIDRRVTNKIRRRHIRVAETEIKHILRPDLSRTLPSIFKNRPNRRLLCPKPIHFLRNHRILLPPSAI